MSAAAAATATTTTTTTAAAPTTTTTTVCILAVNANKRTPAYYNALSAENCIPLQTH